MTRDDALQRGIDALARVQAHDGSFPLLKSKDRGPWRPCSPLFSTACIVLAAGAVLPPSATARALEYLVRARRPDGQWHFDPALSAPPDSDCTACALAALARFGEAPRDGVAALRSYWREDGGPFRTWVGGGMWEARERDDAVVNCNVLHALRLLDDPDVKEIEAVRKLTRASVRGPRYYAAPAALAYAARRAGLAPSDVPPIASKRPAPGELIAGAQWLIGMQRRDAQIIEALRAAQRPDGLWPLETWCTGVNAPAWGSEAVTSAFVLEALAA